MISVYYWTCFVDSATFLNSQPYIPAAYSQTEWLELSPSYNCYRYVVLWPSFLFSSRFFLYLSISRYIAHKHNRKWTEESVEAIECWTLNLEGWWFKYPPGQKHCWRSLLHLRLLANSNVECVHWRYTRGKKVRRRGWGVATHSYVPRPIKMKLSTRHTSGYNSEEA